MLDPIAQQPYDRTFAPLLPTGSEMRLGLRTTPLFDLPLVAAERDTVARRLVRCAAAGTRVTVQFINAHSVNTLLGQRSGDDGCGRAYGRALRRADLLLPDGSGMALAAKLAGRQLGDNLNGTDLFPELCRHAAERGQSLFLLGGKPGIAAAAAAAMQARFPALAIAGTHDGYSVAGRDQTVIDTINASGADIVLVGFGTPLQECWIDRMRPALGAPVVMGVGGLFDYYSGAIARAPKAVRLVGCEWVWRLALEPRRLFVRYVLGNPCFIARAMAHGLAARGIGTQLEARTGDLGARVLALLLLVLVAPTLLALAFAIRLVDGGPALTQDLRIGADGRPFGQWQLRLPPAAQDRGLLQRVLARLLTNNAMTSVPALFNVLSGELALFGPAARRPHEWLFAVRPANATPVRPGAISTLGA